MTQPVLAARCPCTGYVFAMRRFHFHRDINHTGVSGVGCVAQGIEFDDGRVVLVWMRPPHGMSTFASIEDMLSVHAHGEQDPIVWEDD